MEKYNRLFSLPNDLYIDDSPVVISAGVLLSENDDKKLAQLKFKSIVSKKISAITVIIKAFDSNKNLIGNPIEYQYSSLSAQKDDYFGQFEAINLPENTTTYNVRVAKVDFDDGGIWIGQDEEWKPQEKNKTTHNKNIVFGLLGVVCVVLAIAAFLVFKKQDTNIQIKNLDLSWYLVADLGDKLYQIDIESETKTPFIAVLNRFDKKRSIDTLSYIFVEDGKGSRQERGYVLDTPSDDCSVIGYIVGKSLDDDEISYTVENVFDSGTIYNAKIAVNLKDKTNGILWCDVLTDGKLQEVNIPINIKEGAGEYVAVIFIQDGINYKNITLKANMYCETESINDSDLSVIEDYSVSSDDSSILLEHVWGMKYSYKNHDDGVILYTATLKEGGMYSAGYEHFGEAILEGGICKIRGHDFNGPQPIYEIKPYAYIKVNKIK